MQKWKRIAAVMPLAFAGVSGTVFAQEAPAQFEDGQKAVFFGDSITHEGWYAYYVQLFYATRFPDRKITIENAGVAGGTAAGSLSRIEQDVLACKPDWVYIMFGMNDVGRNNYKSAQADEKTLAAREGSLKTYKLKTDEIIKKIKASGAAPVVVTPSPYDQYGQGIKAENLAACNDGLAKCAEIARALAAENKCPVADIHAPMTALMIKDPESKLAGDGRVHPDQAGHMVMAYYILQAQKIPGLVSKTVIDCAKRTVARTENCSAENLEVQAGSVKFTYIPKALPFPLSGEYSKANKTVPWESLNQEIIQVMNLPAGDYRLLAGGKGIGSFSAAQFASGVNLAALATPQQGQSARLRKAVIAKANADFPLRNVVQGKCILWDAKIDPADFAASDKYLDEWLAQVSDQYKKYYTAVIKAYRENRGKLPELTQKAADAQENIFKFQKPEPFVLEIVVPPHNLWVNTTNVSS